MAASMKVASAIGAKKTTRLQRPSTFGANISLQVQDEDNLKTPMDNHKLDTLKTPMIILVVYAHLHISPQFWRVI